MNDLALEVKNLSFTYPDGTQALSGINFSVRDGERVGFIGGNGAGKSTLLLHLNGTLRSNGSVKIFGLEINDKNIHCIRKRVGLIFQNPDDQLFMPTVFDDVSFGPVNMNLEKDEIIRRSREALSVAGMEHNIKRSSHHLSFGEKKRVSFATVLSMKPDIILLDEPTANLDPGGRRELIDFLKTIKTTKIIASHDLEMIYRLCGRTMLLNKGRIIADGETQEMLIDKELLESNALEAPLALYLSG
ncbi:MAG: ABC transporter ATP-binding protein [Candidatus Omnitrophica bacterium]|nr:ABC transporter ATP-binding protein [Candidatus Omnitrophota bacterium]